MRPTLEILVDRIDLLAYHIGALEAENAALRRATDVLAQHLGHTIARADAQIDREMRGAATSKPRATLTPIGPRMDWSALGPVTRRRIA